MRIADLLLRCLVRRRDRDTISGDLLEEYREEIRPRRGAVGAGLWYARQLVSFVSPAAWAVLLGVALNGWILFNTAVAPMAEDSGLEMPIALAGILLVAVVVSIREARDRGAWPAIVAGISFGVVFAAIALLAALVRVNVFLEVISQRADWAGLIARYHASGFSSLRAYANYEYTTGAPLLLGLGAICGAMGGAFASIFRARRVTAVS